MSRVARTFAIGASVLAAASGLAFGLLLPSIARAQEVPPTTVPTPTLPTPDPAPAPKPKPEARTEACSQVHAADDSAHVLDADLPGTSHAVGRTACDHAAESPRTPQAEEEGHEGAGQDRDDRIAEGQRDASDRRRRSP